MVQPDVTAADVVAAVAEFDELGRQLFLSKYGFGEAQSYFLVRGGRDYDSKAIVGAAHRRHNGDALGPADFSGGEATVKRLLESLGFTVRLRRNPSWSWDEVVLACELVHANGWRYMTEEDPRAVELSSLLRRLPLHPADVRTDTFRNPAGVARKTADIATQHPDYVGSPTKGGQHDRAVLLAFVEEPHRMIATAHAIREAASTVSMPPELDLDDRSVTEGGLLERLHLSRERDPQLRRRKLAAVRRDRDSISCEVCGFDFEHTYGERGHEYIECHHRLPLHASGRVQTKLADLALLCSNCHRMIHRRRPWLTVDDLVNLVGERRPT